MGKTKQKRHKAPKPLPTGLPSVRDLEREAANGETNPSAAQQTAANVMEKLRSSEVEEREYACTAIATCANQPGAIQALINADALRPLVLLIVDPSVHIRQSVLGALRNLSVDGGPEVCKLMVDKDIFTPLNSLINQYGVGWSPEHSQARRKADVKVEIFSQAIHLLANLCESTELAVTVFNKEKLASFLLPCLDAATYGYPLAIAAAQCLYTVSEDNTDMTIYLTESNNMAVLQSLAKFPSDTTAQLLLRTLAIGILCNSQASVISQVPGNVLVPMVTSLADVITHDPLVKLEQAADKLDTTSEKLSDSSMEMTDVPGSSQVQESAAEMLPDASGDGISHGRKNNKKSKDNKENSNKPVVVELEDVQYLLTAQQVALELLTNLCITEGEGEEWEDLDSSSSSDDTSALDDVIADDVRENNNLFSALCIPTEIHSAFTSNELVDKVLAKAKFTSLPPKVLKCLENDQIGKTLVKSLSRVQSHALLCINNLVTCMDVEALGGAENLHSIWLGLLHGSTSAQALESPELLESVTSAMRAVIEKLAVLQSPKFSEVTGADLQLLFEMGGTCGLKEVRVNAVRVISTVGCILSKSPQPHPLLKDIGLYLVGVACQDRELWVIAEALDSIFDVFSEDHTDPVVREIGLLDKLNKMVPALKAKISGQKKHLGEHYPVISTARTNLIRFIKYKTQVGAVCGR